MVAVVYITAVRSLELANNVAIYNNLFARCDCPNSVRETVAKNDTLGAIRTTLGAGIKRRHYELVRGRLTMCVAVCVSGECNNSYAL